MSLRSVPVSRGLVLVLLGAALCAFAPAATAHEVVTHDGTRYEGRVVSEDDDAVVIETTFEGTKTIARSDVKLVNTNVPPLRDQLQFRGDQAKDDVKQLWALYNWAKSQKFREELELILTRIVELAPSDKRARKKLGHIQVDGQWMAPEEKEAYERQKQAEEMRAKGLILYDGRWVTPEEKEALEKGLMRDGDDWVTEEEYHKRRGERLVGGKWIKLGFEEGDAFVKEVSRETRVPLQYVWAPHFDILAEVKPQLSQRVADAAEGAYAELRRVLRPTDADYPESIDERIRLALFKKAPAYARFTKWFAEFEKCDELVPGWASAVRRQHSFWWTHPTKLVGCYQFPNTEKTFTSNVLHNVGLVMLTRYKINYKYPSVWLREGFAYHLEMVVLKYSHSFTLGRGGSSVAGSGESGPVWADSKKWRGALKKLVAEGRDPPLKRIAAMNMDQFGYIELVKSWSVVEALIRWDPAKFKAFVDLTKQLDSNGEPKDEQEALKEVFGVTYRELDAKWRAYVTAGFAHQ